MISRRRGRRSALGFAGLALAVTAPLALASPASAAGDDAAMRQATEGAASSAAQAVSQGPARPATARAAELRAQAVTASAGLYDAVGDNQMLAPDLQRMTAFTSDDGRYTVGISLDTNALVDGDSVMTFVNTDGNPATGEPTFGGADLAVTIIGRTGTDAVAAMTWNGYGWQAASLPSLISFATGATDEVWSIAASDLGIAPGTPTTLVFASMYEGLYDDYFDFAPDPGMGVMTFVTGAPAPAPAPPAPPAVAPSKAVAGIPGGPTAPLAVRAFGLRPSRGAAVMRLRWTGGSGGVSWRVRLSARVHGRAAVRTASGAGAPGTRTITRAIALPATWRGARVTARLSIRDRSRALARTASLRVPR